MSRTRTRSQVEVVFGQQVRALRRAAGATQADIAAAMTAVGWRLESGQVAKLERAERPVNVGEMLALADVLGVAPSQLISPVGLSESERRQIKIDAERRAATIRLDAAMRAVREAQADLAKIDADAGRLP